MKFTFFLSFFVIYYTSIVNGQCKKGNLVRFGRGNYMFSWENAATQGQELDWGGAQSTCRQYCMNLVSLESPEENNFVKQKMAASRKRFIWTSGRKNEKDGWFWSGSGVRIARGDWSHTGGAGIRQPDNRENTRGLVGYMGNEESCLAIFNNFYSDGIKWHDVACYHQKPFVCEV